MAFPGIVNSATTDGSSATATPTINLPASIVAGNILIGIFRTAGNDTGSSGFTGWTIEYNSSVPNADDNVTIFWKRADGDEGASFTIDASDDRFVAIVYQIEDVHATTDPAFNNIANNTNDSPNPNTITPGGGAQDFLWIWAGSWVGKGTSPPDNLPTGYSDIIGASSGGAGSAAMNCRAATCTQQTNASNLGRESLTLSNSFAWVAWQFAIFPAAGGTTHSGAASVSGAATITDADGVVDHQADADVTGAATVTLATAKVEHQAIGSVTGTATVTLATAKVEHQAIAGVTGTATVTLATAKVDHQAIGSVTGAATVTLATAKVEHQAIGSVTGACTIDTANGSVKKLAEAEAAGAAVASALAEVDHQAAADVTGVGTVTLATAKVDLQAAASVTGNATVTLATAQVDLQASASVSGAATVDVSGYLNIIYGVPWIPDASSSPINVTGDYTDLQDDPADIDANWVEAIDETSNTLLVITFEDSLEHKIVQSAASTHLVRATVRKTSSGGTNPDFVTLIYDGIFGPKATPIDQAIGDGASVMHQGFFAINNFAQLPAIRVMLIGQSSTDRSVDFAATRLFLTMESVRGNAPNVTGTATVTLADGGVIRDGAAAVTGNATITDATAEVDHQAVASVTGVCTITLATGSTGTTHQGAASVTGAATISDATAQVDHQAIASVTGVASITLATAVVDYSANASVSGSASVSVRGYLNIIYGVPFAPDGEASNTNMLGTWEDIDDDPYSIDGNWLDVDDETSVTFFVLEFPDSLHAKVVKASELNHQVVITLRKNASGGTDPTFLIAILNNAVSIGTPINGTTVTSPTEQTESADFSLEGLTHPTNFRVAIQGTSSGDRNIDIAAVRVYLAMESVRGNAPNVTGVATVTLADGGLVKSGAASVSGAATITDATAEVLHIAAASVTGVCTITLATGEVGGIQSGAADVTGIATVTDATAAVDLQADASVTGVGDINADADLTLVGLTSVTGIATVTLATAEVNHSASAGVTGIATIDADADRILGTTASVTGICTITLATGDVVGGIQSGAADVTGSASIAATAKLDISADADVTGIATVNAAPGLTQPGAATVTGTATVSVSGHLNIIYDVPFAPNFEAVSVNVTGDYTDLDEDPFDIDANWVEAIDEETNTVYWVRFATSLANKVVVSPRDVHTVVATVRKSGPSGGNQPDFLAFVYDNIVERAIPIDEPNVSNETSVLYSGSFAIDDTYTNLGALGIMLFGATTNSRVVDFGAVRIYLSMESVRGNAPEVTGEATAAATGGITLSASADVTGSATVVGTPIIKLTASASVTGIASVYAEPTLILKVIYGRIVFASEVSKTIRVEVGIRKTIRTSTRLTKSLNVMAEVA